MRAIVAWLFLAFVWPTALALPSAVAARDGAECVKDVAFALDQLQEKCGALIEQKGIDWKAVRAEMTAAAKAARDDSDHLFVLLRVLARLRDGHAEVVPADSMKQVQLPERLRGEKAGAGLFFCQGGGKLLVKNSWSSAAAAGIAPGMEVVKVDGQPAAKWLAARVAELRDWRSYSTDHQANFAACHWGLEFAKGQRVELELKDLKGKKVARTVTCEKPNLVPDGPAFLPEGLATTKDLKYGRTVAGFGYVHLRRCPSDLPEQMDVALATLQDAKGLILDFRGNSGGSFDHEAFMGRFVPSGKTLDFAKRYESAGASPYGGPIVVIIDATVRSAGETAAAIFREDGRAYTIGESPTAGMSASKETLALPSGKFSLYVAVASNLGRANGGKGLEGIGALPHETVAFTAKELAAGIDTLIARAEALLQKYPQAKVPYEPAKFGWE